MAKRTGSIAIAQHLCRIFPGTSFIGNGVVCKPAPVHFIEGAYVEYTSYKGTFYLWSLMSPMWAAIKQPILNYSERLSHCPSGRYTSFFEGPEQEIAERAAELFRANKVFTDRLEAPETSLESFLSDKVPDGPYTAANSIRLEHRGLALALLGHADAALKALTTVVNSYSPSRRSLYGEKIIGITQSLAAGDGHHIALITEMEIEAAKSVGLTRRASLSLPGA
jgi:hypothetical protein